MVTEVRPGGVTWVEKLWSPGFGAVEAERHQEAIRIHYQKLKDWAAMDTEHKSSGGSSTYYCIPSGCKDLQDLIEHKAMGFSEGNIFKAVYRLGEKTGTSRVYDLNKIIWFAQRLLNEELKVKA